jgi:hypothetical protein
VPVRVNRVERQRAAQTTEREIAELAAFYGLDPGEVRAERRTIQEHRARYGREPIETTIERLAAEFDLDPNELRAEYEATRQQWEQLR